MLVAVILFLITCFLAYANGANDNFKGVATLFGSGAAGYRTALWWAAATTLAGSVSSVYLAGELVRNFSGKGLVPDALIASPAFLLSVAAGAGATVMLATRLGFPVSTTHGLTGALVGCGLAAAGWQVNFDKLGGAFFLPLLASPLVSLCLGGGLYALARRLNVRRAVEDEVCVCVAEVMTPAQATRPAAALALEGAALSGVGESVSLPGVSVGTTAVCAMHGRKRLAGFSPRRALDAAHFLSAGSVCFARALNDTPKIVALLMVVKALGLRSGILAVAFGMTAGGLLGARKVAETMSRKITPLTPGQGFTANLVTAALVVFASRLGLPVSTTHVSCGSIFGIGLLTRRADTRVISEILMSWLLTLPTAAVIGAAVYYFAG
ncbi:MAG TPA: anion permease [Pyrinomonadaceae bacterium]|nr:anion permease [Pyrinomonadaceae bacterium]